MQLINRLSPIPLVSLVSHVERLRLANYYEEPRWYRELLPQPLPENLNLLRSSTAYHCLADLTGLSVDELYALTLHRFAPVFYGGEALAGKDHGPDDLHAPMWEWRELRLYVHGARTYKLCPLCYHDHKSLLLPWSLRNVTSCPVHNVLLVDTCSSCETPLRVDLSTGECANCKQEIAALPTKSFTDDPASVALIALVWSALGCGNTLFPPAMELSSKHPLHSVDAATLLIFLWRGAQLLLTRDLHNPIFNPALLPATITWDSPPRLLRLANVQATHAVLTGMWRLLRDWPDSWYVTLDRLLLDETGDQYRFPMVLRQEFMGDEWNWLHQSWMDYMQSRITTTDAIYPWLRYYRIAQRMPDGLLPEFLSQREAARLLGISERNLRPHIEAGALEATRQPLREHKRQWQLIAAESAKRLRLERETHLTLAHASAFLGISEEQTVALVETELIVAVQGPLVDGSAIWRFKPDALHQGLAALLGHLPIRPIPVLGNENVCYLTKVQRMLTAIGVALPRLLLLVRDGTLPTYRVSDGVGLHLLWWEWIAVRRVMVELCRVEGRTLLSMTAVCKRLECKPETLRRLYAAGLLIPVHQPAMGSDERWYYNETDVEAYLEQYITSDAAAVLLGVARLTVQSWVRSGRLTAVTGPDIDGSHAYRFEKAAIVQWRHERLTFGEAMKLLGVSKATLDRWAKQGKLTSLIDIDGKQRWFARAEVERLRSGIPPLPLTEPGSDTDRHAAFEPETDDH